MKKIIILMLLISSTTIFSQDITNKLGTSGIFTVKDVSSNTLISTDANNTLIKNGIRTDTKAITDSYSITSSDYIILADAGSSSDLDITLPDPALNVGSHFIIKRLNDGKKKVKVNQNGSETIDGGTRYELKEQYGSVEVVSDGTNWHIVTATKEPSGIKTVSSSSADLGDNTNIPFVNVNFSGDGSTTTLALPVASDYIGRYFIIKRNADGIDNGTNTLTLDPDGTEKIDGSPTYSTTTDYETVTIRSNGTSWNIVGRYRP